MGTSLRETVETLLLLMEQRKEFKSLCPETRNMLDRALDVVVDGTDKNIRLVPGYQRKLHKSILNSLNYADELIGKIPQPIELRSEQFVDNPYIRAFFHTITGLKKVCNRSSELKEYFMEPEHRLESESCALLCMRKVEEKVLGMELQGDQVVRDVMQTQVTFVSHRIQSPAENECIARRELKCCIFEGLVDNALADISARRAKRRQLETERQMLSTKLRSHHGVAVGEGEERLQEVDLELNKIGYVTPESSLERVNEILDHPEIFASIKNASLQLDRAGRVKSDNEQSGTTSRLNFSEVCIDGQPPRVVTLVRVQRDDLEFPGLNFPRAI